ncbi:MAG: hypothetical protein IPK98_16710 [Chloracidobacterium sp.]|nr:hypothetical protein [Chloracidobacterium sp.]
MSIWRLAAGKRSGRKFDALATRNSRSLTIVDRPGSAQSNIVITNLGIDRNDPDYFPDDRDESGARCGERRRGCL